MMDHHAESASVLGSLLAEKIAVFNDLNSATGALCESFARQDFEQIERLIAARGELRHDPCHFIDILPTVISLAGGEDIAPQWNGQTVPPLPGRNLSPAVTKDGAVTHDFLYFHHLTNRAIRVGDWKLVAKGDNGPWELYDLKTDRCEQKNLAERHPDRAREMSAQWQKCEDEFRRQAGPPPEKPAQSQKKKAKQKKRKET